jgi:hypothetical protein
MILIPLDYLNERFISVLPGKAGVHLTLGTNIAHNIRGFSVDATERNFREFRVALY